jgi:hypothetical protein
MARRYRAPSENGGLLIDPPFDAVPRLIEENRKKLDRDDVRIGGVSLRQLRVDVRLSNVLPRSGPTTGGGIPAPLIITGHQPELFHPGVWVKNFASAGLAKRVGGHAVHLTVDNDIVHSTDLAVPHWHTDPSGVHVRPVPFDRNGQAYTHELRPIFDATLFNSVPDRLVPEFSRWPFRPVLPAVWLKKLSTETVLDLFVTARYGMEAELGCVQWTGSVSHSIRCESWHALARHLLADAGRFASIHNAALAAYRKEHKLRSHTHPFPDLAPNEAPFWVLDQNGKRTRCFVPFAGDPKSLRPRALTLTLFARLILGDFFIHGIGGAKYDEVTDRVIRDYFGIDPPAYQVVTGTLHLPFPLFPRSAADVRHLERLRRDLDWNPHRHLTVAERSRPDVAALLSRRASLRASQHATKAARREHFREQRAVVEALRPLVADRVTAADCELATARVEAAANAVLTRRDYAWVLYPREVLVPFLQKVQALAAGNPR